MVHQEVHEITSAATINGPLRPAANMKLKCPSSWLPRVKLTRLRFIGASLASGCRKTEFLTFAHVRLVSPTAQRVVGGPCQQRINPDHEEHRAAGNSPNGSVEPRGKLVLGAGIGEQGANPLAHADPFGLGSLADHRAELAGDVNLETDWPCHTRTPCGQEPGSHCERRGRS